MRLILTIRRNNLIKNRLQNIIRVDKVRFFTIQ